MADNHINFKLIGKRIKHFRNKSGLTQAQLAEKLDFSSGYISQIERGLTKVNLDTLGRVCNIIHCDVGDILNHTNTGVDYMMPEFHVLLEKLKPADREMWHQMLSIYVAQHTTDSKK